MADQMLLGWGVLTDVMQVGLLAAMVVLAAVRAPRRATAPVRVRRR